MLIIGAKGFAKELLQVLENDGVLSKDLTFFDNLSADLPRLLFDRFQILRSFTEMELHFSNTAPEFALGVGTSMLRYKLSLIAIALGGKLSSIISNLAMISTFGTELSAGLCIMQNAIIESDVYIGEGSLIHNSSMIAHEARIGEYCVVSPGSKILGRVQIGNMCEIGSNAVILPNIRIGENVKVGAGAVVTKDVSRNMTVVGVPAKELIRDSDNDQG